LAPIIFDCVVNICYCLFMARPREFDVDEALTKAMFVFWEHGFHCTTFEQLTESMELRKQSVYGAFGDKRFLFIKSLELYRQQTIQQLEDAISQPGSALLILEGIYRNAIRPMNERECPEGCLIANTALEFGLADEDIAKEVSKLFSALERLFVRLVARGQKCGEITTDIEAELLAQSIINTLSGFRVLEKAGVPNDKIQNILRLSIKLLKS
jgi:TetR/AcrR family transcriptional regulator, transcriptional repressor for nem operon